MTARIERLVNEAITRDIQPQPVAVTYDEFDEKLTDSAAFTVFANAWWPRVDAADALARLASGDLTERQSSNDEIADTLIGELAPLVINMAMLVAKSPCDFSRGTSKTNSGICSNCRSPFSLAEFAA